MARRYKLYFLVTREILFLSREHKIHIFELTCNVLFILLTNNRTQTQTAVKKREMAIIIDIFTSKDMENTPLRSQMWFRMNFTSGVF